MLRKHLFCFEEDTGGGSGGAGFECHVDEAQDHVQQAAQAANQAAQTAPTETINATRLRLSVTCFCINALPASRAGRRSLR